MRGLSIGQLADMASVNLETIRYYERIGIMPVPGRTAGGHRNYDESGVQRLTFIRRARELGFSIEDIRALLALSEPDRGSCAEVREIAAAHLDTVEAKILDLRRLEKILSATVKECSGGTSPDCPVLEMLSK